MVGDRPVAIPRAVSLVALCVALGIACYVVGLLALSVVPARGDAVVARSPGLAWAQVLVAIGCGLALSMAAFFIWRRRFIRGVAGRSPRDALAGVGSPRHFLARAERAVAAAHAGGQPLAVLKLCVDGFRQVNRQHGRAAGDALLRAVARHCAEAARGGDVVGCLGGGQFAVVLADTAGIQAVEVAERLRQRAVATTLAHGAAIRPTLSIGMCMLHSRETLGCALRRADAALFMARRNGGNRVVAADGLWQAGAAVRGERASAAGAAPLSVGPA